MKKVLVFGAALAFAVSAMAEKKEINGQWYHVMPTNAQRPVSNEAGGGGGGNLTNHGGPTITSAHVVCIFWNNSSGSAWGSQASPSGMAASIAAFFGAFGQTGEYNTITQYSGIQKTNLSNAYYVEPVAPTSTNVTDTMIQNEVKSYLTQYHGGVADASTIYEVFLPSGYFSSMGSQGSCGATGGVTLAYCAYHSNFNYNGVNVKYSSMPYPSCSGCQSSGFTTTENFEHFCSHETREAVTDEDGNAWYDRRGYEADDKCAWSPAPFTDVATGSNTDGSAYAYQYEWSNAVSGCVKTR